MKRQTMTMSKSGSGCGRIEHIGTSIAAAALGLLLFGCASAKISGQREVGAAPMTRPAVIYVTDFELDAQNIQREPGLLPPPPLPPGPLGNILPKPSGAPKDTAVRARELVDLMSTSLVENLTHAPYCAWGPHPYPIYYPYPYTYGAGAVYNPHTGLYGAGSAVYGPYSAVGRAGWYNRTYAATRQGSSPYGQWGSSVAIRGDDWMRTQHATTSQGSAFGYQTSQKEVREERPCYTFQPWRIFGKPRYASNHTRTALQC